MFYEYGINESDHATGLVLLVVKMEYEQIQGCTGSEQKLPVCCIYLDVTSQSGLNLLSNILPSVAGSQLESRSDDGGHLR